MKRLRGLKLYYLAVTSVLYLVTAAVAIGCYAVLREAAQPMVANILAGAILVAGGCLVSAAGSAITTRSVEFLAMAILHVARDNTTVAAPDIGMVPASRDFFKDLAEQVYQLASANPGGNSLGPAGLPESTLSHAPLPVFALDPAGKIIYANKAALEFSQLRADQLGAIFYDAVRLHYNTANTIANWVTASRQTKATADQQWERVKFERPDGQVFQLDIAVHFTRDSSPVETVIIFADNTQRYANDDRGVSMVAMAVHELRTPLTVMRGYIEVFQDEIAAKLDPEQLAFMHNMNAQAQQLTSFVSSILNFAKIEDGQFSVNLKEEQWIPLAERTVRDMELRASVRHKTIQLIAPSQLPSVAIDAGTMYEVLVNLLENAVKYTHTDAPIIVRTYLKDTNWVETVVEDKGIGIPDNLIGHLFDKFYRSHRTSKDVGGTGLGLYLCKAIVTAHGGNIWVKSKENEGSSFGFTIPTYSAVAQQLQSSDNTQITKGTHGWIKNHTMYRG